MVAAERYLLVFCPKIFHIFEVWSIMEWRGIVSGLKTIFGNGGGGGGDGGGEGDGNRSGCYVFIRPHIGRIRL